MCWSMYIKRMIIEEGGFRTIYQKKWGICGRKTPRTRQQHQYATKWLRFNNKSR